MFDKVNDIDNCSSPDLSRTSFYTPIALYLASYI